MADESGSGQGPGEGRGGRDRGEGRDAPDFSDYGGRSDVRSGGQVGKADRSSIAPGDFGESFGPNSYGGMSPANRALFDQLHREHVESLTGWGKTERALREAFGGNPGAFGFSEWGHPAGITMDLAEKALGLFAGPIGSLAGRAARGLSEISTGTSDQHGGGFGKGRDVGGERGLEATGPALAGGTPGLGQSVLSAAQAGTATPAPAGGDAVTAAATGDASRDPGAVLSPELLARLEVENPSLAAIVKARLAALGWTPTPVLPPIQIAARGGVSDTELARRMFGQQGAA